MNVNTIRKLFSPGVIVKHMEAWPLMGVVVFGASFMTFTGLYEMFTRTDAKWDRWNNKEQYVKFNDNDRMTQWYWHDKPVDTSPEVIKKLRIELAKPSL